jgi:hypothetical protein
MRAAPCPPADTCLTRKPKLHRRKYRALPKFLAPHFSAVFVRKRVSFLTCEPRALGPRGILEGVYRHRFPT